MIQEQQPKLGFFDFQFRRSYYSKLLLILLLETIVFVSFFEIIEGITYEYILLFLSCSLLCITYFSLYLVYYMRKSNAVLSKIYEKIHMSFKFYDKDNHQVSLKVMIIILVIKIILFSSLCYFIINFNYYRLHDAFRVLELVRFRDDYEILIQIVILLQFSLFVFTVYILEYLFYSYKKKRGKKSLIIGLILLLLFNLLTFKLIVTDPIPYQCDWVRKKDIGRFVDFEVYSDEDYQVCRKFAFTDNPYILANLIINTLDKIDTKRVLISEYSIEDDFILREKILDMIYFNEKLKKIYMSSNNENYIALKYTIPSYVSQYTEIYPWRKNYIHWDWNVANQNINEFHKLRDKEDKTKDDILKLGDIYFYMGEYDIAEQYYLQYKKPEVIAEKLKKINEKRNEWDSSSSKNYYKIIYDIIRTGFSQSGSLANAYFESAMKNNRSEHFYLSILYSVEGIKKREIVYSDIKLIRDKLLQYNFDYETNKKLRKNDYNKLVEMYINNDPLTKMFAEYYYYYLKFTFRYDRTDQFMFDPRSWTDPNNTLYDPNAGLIYGKIVFNNETILQGLKSNPYATELVKAMEEEREKVKNSIRYEVLLKLQKEGIEFTR
ncbi:hypothetical protein [Glaesserella parasuis]|uniref:hypothetical protein n=1 Tax=Glaesserella parasuis TaxID=738 RepID=UPI003854CB21